VSQRVDFSGNASTYDRRHGTVLALDAAYELARRAALRPGCCVLDVAAGTGRVTIAFASIGSETVRNAPDDDEPETEEEKMAVAEAREWLAKRGGRGIPHEEAMRRLGLT
jgi:hypothetical protein